MTTQDKTQELSEQIKKLDLIIDDESELLCNRDSAELLKLELLGKINDLLMNVQKTDLENTI